MSAEVSESHRQAMEIASNAVASQLAIGKSKKSIVHQLVKNHWPEEWAVKLVNDVDENLEFLCWSNVLSVFSSKEKDINNADI